jgi:hypothetical protein
VQPGVPWIPKTSPWPRLTHGGAFGCDWDSYAGQQKRSEGRVSNPRLPVTVRRSRLRPRRRRARRTNKPSFTGHRPTVGALEPPQVGPMCLLGGTVDTAPSKHRAAVYPIVNSKGFADHGGPLVGRLLVPDSSCPVWAGPCRLALGSGSYPQRPSASFCEFNASFATSRVRSKQQEREEIAIDIARLCNCDKGRCAKHRTLLIGPSQGGTNYIMESQGHGQIQDHHVQLHCPLRMEPNSNQAVVQVGWEKFALLP